MNHSWSLTEREGKGKVAFTRVAFAARLVEGTQKTTMIHIFRIYSKPSFGSLPNLFFRAKAGSLIVPVLIPSRRNALHSGGVGGGGGVGVARYTRYANFQSFPSPFHSSIPPPSPPPSTPSIDFPRLAFANPRLVSLFPYLPSW